MTVAPACRDYETTQEAREAWTAGATFRVLDATESTDRRYINREEADRAGVSVIIGFCHLTKWIELHHNDPGAEQKEWARLAG